MPNPIVLLVAVAALTADAAAFGVHQHSKKRTSLVSRLLVSMTESADEVLNTKNKAGGDDHEGGCPCCGATPLSETLLTPMVTPRFARIMAPLLSLSIPLPSSAESTSSPFHVTIDKCFPGAMPSAKVAKRLQAFLTARNYKATNTLLGTSLCPDEINSKPNGRSLSNVLQQSFNQNGVFPLGGLAGLPFVGISGMKAFLSHCPDQGKVLIVFGPHVGVSEDGVVGEVHRVGQGTPTTSCGAAIGAFKAIQQQKNNNSNKSKNNNFRDFQEDYIVSKLRQKLQVTNSRAPTRNEAYSMISSQLFVLIVEMLLDELGAVWSNDPTFWDRIEEVVLIGGIVINRDQDSSKRQDYFEPKFLESFTKPTTRQQPNRVNYYSEVFER